MPDDIEIGCGGTLLALTRAQPGLEVTWVVLAAAGERAARGRASAAAFLADAGAADVRLHEFRDGFLPYVGRCRQGGLRRPEGGRSRSRPHAHARTISTRITASPASSRGTRSVTTSILEYEIPKYDGDLGAPNVFVPLERERRRREAAAARRALSRARAASTGSTTSSSAALMSIRGMESRERLRGGVHVSQADAGRRMIFAHDRDRRRPARSSPSAHEDERGLLRSHVGRRGVRGGTGSPTARPDAASRSTPPRNPAWHALPGRAPRGGEARALHGRRRSSTSRSISGRTRRRSRRWVGAELSAENGHALYVPEGCAHGFLTLADDTEVAYQISASSRPDAARGVRFDDPAFGDRVAGETSLVINERDRTYPDFVASGLSVSRPAPTRAAGAGERMHELADELFPLCRSITGDGVRETLREIATRIPLEVTRGAERDAGARLDRAGRVEHPRRLHRRRRRRARGRLPGVEPARRRATASRCARR